MHGLHMTDRTPSTDRQSCQHANTIDIGAWSWCKGCGSFHIDGEWCRPQYAPEPSAERRPGRSKLVYDKAKRTIVTVFTGPSANDIAERLSHMALDDLDYMELRDEAVAALRRLSGEPRGCEDAEVRKQILDLTWHGRWVNATSEELKFILSLVNGLAAHGPPLPETKRDRHDDDCMYVKTGEHGCTCGWDEERAATKSEKQGD